MRIVLDINQGVVSKGVLGPHGVTIHVLPQEATVAVQML